MQRAHVFLSYLCWNLEKKNLKFWSFNLSKILAACKKKIKTNHYYIFYNKIDDVKNIIIKWNSSNSKVKLLNNKKIKLKKEEIKKININLFITSNFLCFIGKSIKFMEIFFVTIIQEFFKNFLFIRLKCIPLFLVVHTSIVFNLIVLLIQFLNFFLHAWIPVILYWIVCSTL